MTDNEEYELTHPILNEVGLFPLRVMRYTYDSGNCAIGFTRAQVHDSEIMNLLDPSVTTKIMLNALYIMHKTQKHPTLIDFCTCGPELAHHLRGTPGQFEEHKACKQRLFEVLRDLPEWLLRWKALAHDWFQILCTFNRTVHFRTDYTTILCVQGLT